MNRKKYQKPRFISHYINAKAILVGNSNELTQDDDNGETEAKRAYGRFAWDEDED